MDYGVLMVYPICMQLYEMSIEIIECTEWRNLVLDTYEYPDKIDNYTELDNFVLVF